MSKRWRGGEREIKGGGGVREKRELESEKESRRGRKGGKERGWEGQFDRASG